MSNLANLFVNSVRSRMDQNNLTQAKVAESAKMAQPALSKYLSGKNEPGFDIIEKIAGALGCQPWELLKPDDAGHITLSTAERLLIDQLRAMSDSHRKLVIEMASYYAAKSKAEGSK